MAAGIAAFAVYGMTLCPTVYVEGSGELIGAAYRLGTAHPTGYPLFCLGSRLLALALPWVSPAVAINAASALFAAVCCGALAGLLYGRGVQPVVALATALALAFSRTFWSQAVIAEVYGLALLLVVLVLAQALRVCESKEPRQVLLLGWLMGLGLTAHLMQVLVWPGVVAVLAWRWPALWRRPLLMAQGMLAVLGGYSLVAYLPLRNGRGAGFHWGPLDDPNNLVATLERCAISLVVFFFALRRYAAQHPALAGAGSRRVPPRISAVGCLGWVGGLVPRSQCVRLGRRGNRL